MIFSQTKFTKMARKRKSGDGEEEDGASTSSGLVKVSRPRLSTQVQESGVVLSKGWAVKPGMIMEVKMTNFMCHQVLI